mmetsp:Transcript_32400/g.70744  ORF Transcript_32400/g.70744 Transcript_32400/m.70744 type:complete len:266 (+) Transcript_32400:718-1515(+)
MLVSMALWWVAALMVCVAAGSSTITSASDPAATRPFRGKRLNTCAATVEVAATNCGRVILPELTIVSHTICRRSSMPFTPLGSTRKSPCGGLPAAFWVLLNTAWSVATREMTPLARAFCRGSWCALERMGGDMTYCAAILKSGSHSLDSSMVSAEVTVSPITRTPALRAAATSSMASMDMTCTTYSGVLTKCASFMARPVASPSRTLGRESACPSGPTMPFAIISACPSATASPFSAWICARAPMALHWRRPMTSCSSDTMSAPL